MLLLLYVSASSECLLPLHFSSVNQSFKSCLEYDSKPLRLNKNICNLYINHPLHIFSTIHFRSTLQTLQFLLLHILYKRYLLEVPLVRGIQQVPEALVVPGLKATKQMEFYSNWIEKFASIIKYRNPVGNVWI